MGICSSKVMKILRLVCIYSRLPFTVLNKLYVSIVFVPSRNTRNMTDASEIYVATSE